ncbi:MAG: Clp protease N-terminal domain-containing protein [Solirubrobacteraceae bacterium]
MPVRFDRTINHDVFRDADQAARARGSATLEAEHLLLALSGGRDETAALLAEHGLTAGGIDAALAAEFERSLGVAGVRLADYPLPAAPRRLRRGPRVAASVSKALERAFVYAKARRIRRVTAPALLIGILEAEVGTVPRALETAGVERAALRSRAEELLLA